MAKLKDEDKGRILQAIQEALQEVRGMMPAQRTQEEKQTDLFALVDKFQKEFGESSILWGDALPERQRIHTGLFDDIIGGGLPAGSIIEIFGAEGTGKSSLIYSLASRLSSCVYIDTERKYNASWAKSMGLDTKRVTLIQNMFMEPTFKMLLQHIGRTDMIIIDSLSALVPERSPKELLDTNKEPRVAAIASFLSKQLPIINNMCYATGTILVVVNQIRDKINHMGFGDPHGTPGGHQLKHLAMLRLKMERVAWFKFSDTTLKEPYGARFVLTVAKSNISAPMRSRELPLVFGHGYMLDEGEIAVLRKELMREARENQKGDSDAL